MDKQDKLRRYSHKDYSDLVRFPVEIVGRDSVVRRYPYEDAVRLYQRRVAFAGLRYRDRDVVDAEVLHCNRRIDQLRSSYFYFFGWARPADSEHPDTILRGYAGDVTAFLARTFRVAGRLPMRLELVAQSSEWTSEWMVLPEGASSAFRLEVHVFPPSALEGSREQFLASVDRIREESGEWVTAHNSADCGIILSGDSEQFEDAVTQMSLVAESREGPSSWELALDEVRLGQYRAALARLRKLVEDYPRNRRAYILGAVLALALARKTTALEFTALGRLYFPDDSDINLLFANSLAQEGRYKEARTALDSCVLVGDVGRAWGEQLRFWLDLEGMRFVSVLSSMGVLDRRALTGFSVVLRACVAGTVLLALALGLAWVSLPVSSVLMLGALVSLGFALTSGYRRLRSICRTQKPDVEAWVRQFKEPVRDDLQA